MLSTILPTDTTALIHHVQDEDPAAWRSNYTLLRYLKSSQSLQEIGTALFTAQEVMSKEYGEWSDQTLIAIKATLQSLNGLFALHLDGLWGDVLLVQMADEVTMVSTGDQLSQRTMPRERMVELIIKLLSTGAPAAAGQLFMYDMTGETRVIIEELTINQLK